MYLHAILTTYGAIAGVLIMLGIVDEQKLYEQTFVNTLTGEKFNADFWIVLNYLSQRETNFVGVVLLCVVVSVMLYVFFAYHMYLIYNG